MRVHSNEYAWVLSKNNVVNNYYRLIARLNFAFIKSTKDFPIFELNEFTFKYYTKKSLFEISLEISEYFLDICIIYSWKKLKKRNFYSEEK